MQLKALSFFMAVGFACASPAFATETELNLNAVDVAALETIEAHLSFESVQGLDFSEKSKEYCINARLPKGGHMTHYSVSPQTTTEDIIDFVRVDQLVAAGLNLGALPKHPGTLGSMEPGRWYYVPAGSYEPHHGTKLPFAVIVRATDVH